LFEFVRRESHLVHAFAKTLETRLWFEPLVAVVVFAILLGLSVALVVVMGVFAVAIVVPIASSHPGNDRCIVLLFVLLPLLLLLLLLGLSMVSAPVVETNKLFFIVRQFHGFLGFEAFHEFADAFLAVVSLAFLAVVILVHTANDAHAIRVHNIHVAHAHAIHVHVHVIVHMVVHTAVAVVPDHAQAPDHALPQKALLVGCLFFFGFFLDPFRVLVNGRFGQLPQAALAAAAAGQSVAVIGASSSLGGEMCCEFLELLFSPALRTILFHPHLHGPSLRAALDVDAIDNVAIVALAIDASAAVAVDVAILDSAFAVAVPKDHHVAIAIAIASIVAIITAVMIRRLKSAGGNSNRASAGNSCIHIDNVHGCVCVCSFLLVLNRVDCESDCFKADQIRSDQITDQIR
jgi:hypothetical protein